LKALVTGANGFLGKHVVAALVARGHSVRAIVRPATNAARLGWSSEVELFRADLRNSKDLESAFEGVDVLIHLAATVVGDEDAQLAETVVGTTRLVQAMARTQTCRMVLAGSFSVYDWERASGTLTEDTPLAANLYQRDGYAIAKFWQERVVRQAAGEAGCQLTVLRPGFIWGKGNDYLFCLGQSVGPLHLVIGPRTRLPITYVTNCAEAFVLAAEKHEGADHTLNVVDNDSVRAWQYMGHYLRGNGLGGIRVPVPYRAFLMLTYLAQWTSRRIFNGKGKLPSLFVPCRFKARFKPLRYSNELVRAVLNWSPTINFDQAVAATWPVEPITMPVPAEQSSVDSNMEATAV